VSVGQTILLVFVGLQLGNEWTMWNVDEARRERILGALPWAAGVAVALKFLLAAWALSTLHRRGELSDAAVARFVGLWLLTAAGLFALLAWLAPPGVVPLSGLALGVVLFVPLARLAAAPLALAWNRRD
jgi:hypothetical protein